MKPPSHRRPSETEAIAATAAAWLAQRDDGFTPEQAAEFARWRSADVRHEAAAARLEATWTALQQLREFRPEAVHHPDRDLLRTPERRGRLMRPPVLAGTLALAASLILAAVFWFAGRSGSANRTEVTHATTVDGYQRVSLTDGSIVELNSASEIKVNFSPAERRVRLLRGEAHFTVAKNPARPFWVEAEAVAVRAVGTAFNVRLGLQDIEVLVTEGRVAVAAAEENAPSPAAQPPRAVPETMPSRTELRANERVVLPAARATGTTAGSRGPLVVEKVSSEAIREALAWQGPRLVFVDTPLAEAIVQFNRRNPVQLELADAELATLPIGGSLRAENVDAFVRLIAAGGDVTVERPTPTRIVLRKAGTAPRPE